MALGTRLTLIDYLGNQKIGNVWTADQTLLKDVNLPYAPYEKEFEHMLSTCVRGKKSTGLTAADYLSNPVKARSKACLVSGSVNSGTDTVRNFEKACNLKPTGAPGENSSKSDQWNIAGTSRRYTVREDIEQSIEKAARQYDLPSELIKGVIRAESDFQVRAKSPAGALGLMQLMPATARELGVQDPFDIDQNIDAGSRYLKKMLVRFGNDTRKALAAYNSGPGSVERFGGEVPYKETRQYVERVLAFSDLTV